MFNFINSLKVLVFYKFINMVWKLVWFDFFWYGLWKLSIDKIWWSWIKKRERERDRDRERGINKLLFVFDYLYCLVSWFSLSKLFVIC